MPVQKASISNHFCVFIIFLGAESQDNHTSSRERDDDVKKAEEANNESRNNDITSRQHDDDEKHSGFSRRVPTTGNQHPSNFLPEKQSTDQPSQFTEEGCAWKFDELNNGTSRNGILNIFWSNNSTANVCALFNRG